MDRILTRELNLPSDIARLVGSFLLPDEQLLASLKHRIVAELKVYGVCSRSEYGCANACPSSTARGMVRHARSALITDGVCGNRYCFWL